MNLIKKKGGSNKSKQKRLSQKRLSQKKSKQKNGEGAADGALQKYPLKTLFINLPDDIIEIIEYNLAAMTIQEYNEKYNIIKIKNFLDGIFLTYDLYNHLIRFEIFIKSINNKYNSDKEIKQLAGTYLLNAKNNAIKSIQYIELLSKLKENPDAINMMLKQFVQNDLELSTNNYVNHILNTWNELVNYKKLAKEDYRIAELNLDVSPRIDNKIRRPISQREKARTRKIRTNTL